MKSTIGVGAKPMIINQYQIKTKGEDKMKEKQGYKIVDLQKIKLITEPNKKLDETKHAHAEVVKNTKIVVEKQHKEKQRVESLSVFLILFKFIETYRGIINYFC